MDLSPRSALWLELAGMGIVGGLAWWKLTARINKRKASFITDYPTVKAILQSRTMSAAPQRLTYSDNPEHIKALYRFVRLMLLYNDGGHERLRKTYPKLNSKASVEKEFSDFVRGAINKLLDTVKHLPPLCSPPPLYRTNIMTGRACEGDGYHGGCGSAIAMDCHQPHSRVTFLQPNLCLLLLPLFLYQRTRRRHPTGINPD